MASTSKVQILFRHGGNFIRESNKVHYEGGENLIVHVDRDINYDNLLIKVREKCKLIDITSIRYQYPGRDLDVLVSVKEDDDVSSMMKVFPQSDILIDLFVSGAQNFSTLVATTSEPDVHAPEDLNGRNGVDVLFRHAFESNTGDVQNIQNDSHEMERNEVDDLQNLDGGTSGAAALMDFDESRNTGMSFLDSSNLNKGNGFQGNLLNSNNGPIGVASEELNGNKETSIHITKLDTGGANDIKEGKEFENDSAFRKALRSHAIHSNFEYKRTRSGYGVFKARCFKRSCSWSISACETPGKHTFKVKSLKGNHTCDSSKKHSNNRHVTEKWIADFVTNQKLVDRSPNEIVDAINTKYGIKVSYHKARRGKRLAAERDACFEQSTAVHKHRRQKPLAAERDADYEESIKDVLKGIETTNPGSAAKLSRSSDKSLRIFVAYKASIYGFLHGCRPLLMLDYEKIEKYAIVCLHAVAVDAEDETFPVAYAFVESKCRRNWQWFCEELANIPVLKGKIPELTFMLDPKERILEEVVRDVFTDSRHRYLSNRLMDYIRKNFGSMEILILIDRAAEASTQNEFDAKLSALREKSEEAWKFMKGMKPKHWALSHYEGSCHFPGSAEYDHIGDLVWNRHLLNCGAGAKDLHVVPFLKDFHVFIMETFKERREDSSTWTAVMKPTIESRLFWKKYLSEDYRVSSSGTTATEFVVSLSLDPTQEAVVNLQLRTCSSSKCYDCQRVGIPCEHAIAAIRHRRGDLFEYRDLFAYCDEWRTADKYKETYSQPIYPLPDDII